MKKEIEVKGNTARFIAFKVIDLEKGIFEYSDVPNINLVNKEAKEIMDRYFEKQFFKELGFKVLKNNSKVIPDIYTEFLLYQPNFIVKGKKKYIDDGTRIAIDNEYLTMKTCDTEYSVKYKKRR